MKLYAGEEFHKDHSRMLESAALLFAPGSVHAQDHTLANHLAGRRDGRQVH